MEQSVQHRGDGGAVNFPGLIVGRFWVTAEDGATSCQHRPNFVNLNSLRLQSAHRGIE